MNRKLFLLLLAVFVVSIVTSEAALGARVPANVATASASSENRWSIYPTEHRVAENIANGSGMDPNFEFHGIAAADTMWLGGGDPLKCPLVRFAVCIGNHRDAHRSVTR